MDRVSMYKEAALFMPSRAHMWHLNTQSYAAHKALGDFYEELRDMVDSFIEQSSSYTGPMQPVGGVYRFDTSDAAVTGLEQFLVITKQVHEELQAYPGLTNVLGNIMSLTESTLYKLKCLH